MAPLPSSRSQATKRGRPRGHESRGVRSRENGGGCICHGPNIEKQGNRLSRLFTSEVPGLEGVGAEEAC